MYVEKCLYFDIHCAVQLLPQSMFDDVTTTVADSLHTTANFVFADAAILLLEIFITFTTDYQFEQTVLLLMLLPVLIVLLLQILLLLFVM